MSKFFHKKKSSLKISKPIALDDDPILETLPYNRSQQQLLHSSIPRTITIPSNAIVLVAKYNFEAHDSKELTVLIDEPLKLLSRQGNGWLLVKPIGRLGGPGLVPSAYCSVVKTDKAIDNEWLNGSDISFKKPSLHEKPRSSSGVSESSSSDFSNSSLDRTSPTMDSSVEDLIISKLTLTPIVSVKTVSSHKGRYWYRTDFTLLKSGKTKCLCRYYQDFYVLHSTLFDQFNDNDHKIRDLLPNLPGPIPRPDPEVLLQRCHDLNSYIQKLVQFFVNNEFEQKGKSLEVLRNFLDLRESDIEIGETKYNSLTTEEINALIDPLSLKQSTTPITTDAQQLFELGTVSIKLLESAEPSPIPSPSINSPRQYFATSPVQPSPLTPRTPQRRPSLQMDTKLEYSPTSPLFHNDKSKLDFITERRINSPILSTPSSPAVVMASARSNSTSSVSSRAISIKNEDYTRVKIMYNEGNDIIAMKMPRDTNLTVLKLSISSKIHIYDYILSYKDVQSGFFKPLRTNKDFYMMLFIRIKSQSMLKKVMVYKNDLLTVFFFSCIIIPTCYLRLLFNLVISDSHLLSLIFSCLNVLIPSI